jgi:hypothetical protein
MTEGTWSGHLDRSVEPSGIVEMLAGEPMAAAVLALCGAERLSEIAYSLAGSPLARSAVRTGLDLGWSAVAGHDPGPDAIGRAISDLDGLVSWAVSDVQEVPNAMDDAICAALYALEAVRDGNSTAAVNAVERCRDVYFQMTVKTWPGLNLNAWESSPIMQDEVKREVNEAQAIAAWGGVISPERAESLRRAAHADSEILVRLIKGDPRGGDRDVAPSGQEPLL